MVIFGVYATAFPSCKSVDRMNVAPQNIRHANGDKNSGSSEAFHLWVKCPGLENH